MVVAYSYKFLRTNFFSIQIISKLVNIDNIFYILIILHEGANHAQLLENLKLQARKRR